MKIIYFISLAVFTLALAGQSFAQSGTMRENIHRMLERANDLRDEDNFRGATELYNRLLNFSLLDYERAVVSQNFASLELTLENYAEAIRHFEVAVATNALPSEITSQMEGNLIQLYMTQDAYQKTLDLMASWLPRQSDPPVQIFVTAASAATHLNKFDLGIRYIREAIQRSEKPEENWYRLLVALYHEKGDQQGTANALEEIIRIFPNNPEYWRQLSGLYINMGKDLRALGILETAYEKGLLDREEDLLQLVNLYLFLDIPFEGSKILAREIEKGRITANRRNFELLANAFLRARENRDALQALLNAAEEAEDGNLDLRVAQIYVELQEWKSALKHLEAALEKGELRNTGLPFLLMGYAFYALDRREEALEVFVAGLSEKSIERQARQWISYLDPELYSQMQEADKKKDNDSTTHQS